jgi:hypothetical protein
MSWLRSFRVWNNPIGPLNRNHSFFVATLLLRVLFLLAIRNSMLFLNQSEGYIVIPKLELLWPIAWGSFFSRENLILGIASFSIFANFFAFLFVRWRITRILAALAYLFLVTVDFVYANVGHASHATLWLMLLSALAPSWKAEKNPRAIRERVLLNFFHCQLLLTFFYFNAGLWKIWMAFSQLIRGEANAFQLDALSRILAERLLIGNTRTAFGPWLIDQPLLGYFSLWFTIYAELAALLIVFRPQLHRVFGAALILFHLVTALTLAPSFSLNVLALGIFFVLSPFHPEGLKKNQIFFSLPLLGKLFSGKKGFINK